MADPSRREHLERLLDGLWVSFDAAEPGASAGLAREIRALVKELADLAPAEGKSAADELKSRREARRAGAADRAPAARRKQSRRSNGSHRAS